MKSTGRKFPSMPLIDRKDRDEDLLLFREMHKRERDRTASLLQPVSDEFEPHANAGNYALYRIASGKKGSGYEFFAENDKNDYDWLKTPPATPLFPSLEMETNVPELVIQREIPILQPISRFAGNSEVITNGSTAAGRPKTPKQKPKVGVRSTTPSQRQCNSSTETKNTKSPSILTQKTSQMSSDSNNRIKTSIVSNTTRTTTTSQKESNMDFLNSNLSRSIGLTDTTKPKPRSRGVSPATRSTIPAQIPGFSDQPPPNLRTTERSTSATRGRPGISNEPPPNLKMSNDRSTSTTRNRPNNNQTLSIPTTGFSNERSISATRGRSSNINQSLSIITGISNEAPPNLITTTDRSISANRGRPVINNTAVVSTIHQKPEQITKPIRRQSCSPSVTRGRKVELKQKESEKGRIQIQTQTGNATQIFGSRMVDKVMNARKSGAEERETKPKTSSWRGSVAEVNGGGFGRMMSKSSLDMAVKHMEVKRDQINSRHLGLVIGRSSNRD